MQCIDLKKAYPQYRITRDESSDNPRDPWYYQIPGRLGIIYPYGPGLLAVEVDNRPRTAAKLDALGLEHVQCGEQEHTFLFPPARFAEVAAIIRPYRKRTVTPQTVERLRALAQKRRKATSAI